MDFGNNESSSLSSSSSTHSQLLSSPCTHPNPNLLSDSSNPHSHKRKAGRKKFRETRHPVYRGVRQRNGNKWVCEIREPNKKSRIWVGTYPTPEIAARAHDVAVLSLSGTSANFNFPHSVSLLPLAKSCSAIDIRAAAAKATTTITTEANSSKPNTSFSSSHDNNFNFEENGNGKDPCLDMSMHGLVDGISCDDDESETAFFDEEAVYNMPGLLDSMAEGLLITPPSMDWDHNIGSEIDITLWTN